MASAGDSELPLPPVPYAYDALEPHIDEAIMKVHHLGHHQAYTTKTNGAMQQLREVDPDLASRGIDYIVAHLDKVPDEGLRGTFRNHGGGYVNHALFWNVMGPHKGGAPSGAVAEAINTKWGSFDAMKEKFSDAALKIFGSGWTWLYVDKSKSPPELCMTTTANQDTPAMNEAHVPILGLDMWEHAYYLQYKNKKADYVKAWWNVVNWDEVNRRFEEARA